MHLKLLQTLKSWDLFCHMFAHLSSVFTILLSSTERIFVTENRPECLSYLYAICKREYTTYWKVNSFLTHALGRTSYGEPFFTTSFRFHRLSTQFPRCWWIWAICFFYFIENQKTVATVFEEECLSHPTFPRRCHRCDKEGFIVPQLDAFIIYSLWFYALFVSCSTIY